MMEWTIAILLGIAILLFILSFFKTGPSKVDEQLEQLACSFGDELNQIHEKIRSLEIDAEITAQEAGLPAGSMKRRALLHDVLDLYKRGYSLDSIALKKQSTKEEIADILAPYIQASDERGKVSDGF